MRKTAKPQEADEVPGSFAPVVAAFAKDRGVGRGRMFSSSSVLNVNGKIYRKLFDWTRFRGFLGVASTTTA